LRGTTRHLAVLAAAALFLTGCTDQGATPRASSSTAAPSVTPRPEVGIAYDIGGRGDVSFNDSAGTGVDKAKADLGIEVKELSATSGETDADKAQRLRVLAQGGQNPVIAVGVLYQAAMAEVAPEFPQVRFALVDGTVAAAPNVTGLVFTEHQGAFLVGAAAALKSRTGSVAFIGGCDLPLIRKYQAGFEQGVAAARPGTEVNAAYLSSTNDRCIGFNDPAEGREVAAGLYERGADVVFTAAGGSGVGVLEAAGAAKAFVIGADRDQWVTARADVRPFVYTSMLKRVDVAVYDYIEAYTEGRPMTGVRTYGLTDRGVGYATSGDLLDAPTRRTLEKYSRDIAAGRIKVATVVTRLTARPGLRSPTRPV